MRIVTGLSDNFQETTNEFVEQRLRDKIDNLRGFKPRETERCTSIMSGGGAGYSGCARGKSHTLPTPPCRVRGAAGPVCARSHTLVRRCVGGGPSRSIDPRTVNGMAVTCAVHLPSLITNTHICYRRSMDFAFARGVTQTAIPE